jgi:DNA-3-methyladenine glycosylase I
LRRDCSGIPQRGSPWGTRGWSQFCFAKLLLAHAAWIAAEIPQGLHGQIRGIGAESPVFLRPCRKKMCQSDQYGRKKVNADALAAPAPEALRQKQFPFIILAMTEKNPKRCEWCLGSEIYMAYHDTEWGVPVYDDRKHFEFLVLESAQAGLSWITILKRRENYRKAYDGFDPVKVARYGEARKKKLLSNAGIIRNRLKIEASINNARRFLEVQKEFGSFSAYLWGFTHGKPVKGKWKTLSQIPARTELSDRVTKDLKKRGFRFLGSVIMYSHMQATGIVNDHLMGCFRYKEAARSKAGELPQG